MTKEVPRTSVLRDEELIALHKDMMLGVEAGYQYSPKVAQMMHDRIELLATTNEQLVATNEALSISNATLIAERDASEAKLAKAVEALEYYAVESMPWDADDSLIARATLAEIKSGVATTPYGLEGENHE